MKPIYLAPLVFLLSGCLASGGGGDSGPMHVSQCFDAPAFTPVSVSNNADALAFRAKFQSGAPVSIAIIGDSTTVRFFLTVSFDAYLKTKNSSSAAFNFGMSGWNTNDHIVNHTVNSIAALSKKPDAVFIAIGINDVAPQNKIVNGLETLVSQVRVASMLPILVKENSISCSDKQIPQPYWPYVRNEIDIAASATLVDVIDLGTPDGIPDRSLMKDDVHPNAAGYHVILEKYKAWLLS